MIRVKTKRAATIRLPIIYLLNVPHHMIWTKHARAQRRVHTYLVISEIIHVNSRDAMRRRVCDVCTSFYQNATSFNHVTCELSRVAEKYCFPYVSRYGLYFGWNL